MSAENRKKELLEKHNQIALECNKINVFINSAYEKSESAINTTINLNENELLKKFTKVYKNLSNLHVELMDISCQLELFFINYDKEFETDTEIIKVETIKPTIDSNKLFLLNNYLEKITPNYDVVSDSTSIRDSLASTVKTSDEQFPDSLSESQVKSDSDENQETDTFHSKKKLKAFYLKPEKQNISQEGIERALNKSFSENDNQFLSSQMVAQNLQPHSDVSQMQTVLKSFTEYPTYSQNDKTCFEPIIQKPPEKSTHEVPEKETKTSFTKPINYDDKIYDNEYWINCLAKKSSMSSVSTVSNINEPTVSQDIRSVLNKSFTEDQNVDLKKTEDRSSEEVQHILNKSFEITDKNLQNSDLDVSSDTIKNSDSLSNEFSRKESLKDNYKNVAHNSKLSSVETLESVCISDSKSENWRQISLINNILQVQNPENVQNIVTESKFDGCNFALKTQYAQNSEYKDVQHSKQLNTVQNSESSQKSMNLSGVQKITSLELKTDSKFDSVNTKDVMKLDVVPEKEEFKTSSTKEHKDVAKIPYLPDPKEGDLCCLGYVENPSYFYIQLASEEAVILDSISSEIEKTLDNLPFYEEKSQAKTVFKPYCVCYCEKQEEWFRAEVTDWLDDDGDTIMVQLIDYGFMVEAPLTNLREMAKEFYALPIVSLKCHLAFVAPTKGKWKDDAIKIFNDKIKPNVHILYNISFVERQGTSLAIDLMTDECPSIIGWMINSKKAKPNFPVNLGACSDSPNSELSDSSFNQFMKKQIQKSQKFSEDELDDELEEYSNPNIAVTGYDPQDEKRICKFMLQKGWCWKGASCTFVHDKLNPYGWTTDKESVYYNAFNTLDLPGPGITAKVKISMIKDMRTFYIHIKSFPDMYSTRYQPNTLKDLQKLMNSPDEIKNYRSPRAIPAMSQIILVNYEGNWDRAKIVEIYDHAEDITLEVLLVDYGQVITVNIKDVRDIKDKYLQLPFQAVRCILSNTKHKQDLTDEQIQQGLDYIEMCTQDKILNVKIMYVNKYSCLHLGVILYNEDGQDVGRALIDAELLEEDRNTEGGCLNTKQLVD